MDKLGYGISGNTVAKSVKSVNCSPSFWKYFEFHKFIDKWNSNYDYFPLKILLAEILFNTLVVIRLIKMGSSL